MGRRTIIGYYLDANDSRKWINIFEDMKARDCEDVLFISIEADKSFTRALNLFYPNTKVIPSIHEKITKINKYFSSGYKSPIPKEIHDLFLSKDTDDFNNQYQILKDVYSDNKLMLLLFTKNIEGIQIVCNYDKQLRRLLFNYYFLRDYMKKLRVLTTISFDTQLDDIIALILERVIYLEKYTSLTKSEHRHILNILNELFKERILGYL